MATTDIDTRLAKLKERIDLLSQASDGTDGLTRVFCSPAAKKATGMVLSWADRQGLAGHMDAIGNLHITTPHPTPGRKTFYMGSHIDTVVNAGKYDGVLGFLLALDQVERFGEHPRQMPFNLAAIGFSDEEGVRYHCTYLGSSAFAGTFEEALLQRVDDQGVSMAEAIGRFGGDVSKIADARVPSGQFAGYLEVHIEQGPVLQDKNAPVGIVADIAGQARVSVTYYGQEGHAGTVPMGMRQDAACGMASLALAVEAYAHAHRNELVATMGKWQVGPNVANVIPGVATASLDIRSGSAAVLRQACAVLAEKAGAIAEERGLRAQWKPTQMKLPILTDTKLQGALENAIAASDMPVVYTSSGAGHDAVCVSALGPIAMMFVRCKDGVSHSPSEHVADEDMVAAMQACDAFFDGFAQ